MTTLVNQKLKEFDSFSEAFRYAVDKSGVKHSDLYNKIPMDKSMWSKIYNGETKNPQAPTREKLTKVVGVEIRKVGEKWVITDDPRTKPAIDVVNQARQRAARHREVEPTLDDLPELIRLRDRLDELIQSVLRSY